MRRFGQVLALLALLAPAVVSAQSLESFGPSIESGHVFSGGTVTAPILTVTGTAGAPAIAPSAFPTTGMYFAGGVNFSLSGTERLTIALVNSNANVGLVSGLLPLAMSESGTTVARFLGTGQAMQFYNGASAATKISGTNDGLLAVGNAAGTSIIHVKALSTSAVEFMNSANSGQAGVSASSFSAGTTGARVSALGNGLSLKSDGAITFQSATSIDSGSADAGIDRLSAGVVQITNGSTGTGKLLFADATVTIAADDTTPDVSLGNYFVTSANTGATAITDLDNPTPGQRIVICGGSATNSSTIADSGNFNIAGAFTASLDDCITLCVQADNDYVECAARTNN